MDNLYYQQTSLLLDILGQMDWKGCMALKGGLKNNGRRSCANLGSVSL